MYGDVALFWNLKFGFSVCGEENTKKYNEGEKISFFLKKIKKKLKIFLKNSKKSKKIKKIKKNPKN